MFGGDDETAGSRVPETDGMALAGKPMYPRDAGTDADARWNRRSREFHDADEIIERDGRKARPYAAAAPGTL